MNDLELTVKLSAATEQFVAEITRGVETFTKGMGAMETAAAEAGGVDKALSSLGANSFEGIRSDIAAIKAATEQFVSEISQGVAAFSQGMDEMKRSAADAGTGVDQAFKTLGVRSFDTIKADIDKVKSAFAALRDSGASQDDVARAAGAASDRVRELWKEMGFLAEKTASATPAVNSIDQALRSLGIRSTASIRADIEATKAALDSLRASGAGPTELARASDAAAIKVRGLYREMGLFVDEANAADRASRSAASSMGSMEGSAAGLSSVLGDVAHKALAWTAVIAVLHEVEQAFKAVVSTGAEFETLNVRLNTVMKGQEEGAKALEWIKKFAYDTPYQLQEVTKTFITLKNYGIDPTKGAMQAISDTASAYGGKMEQLEGISVALGQAWAKQKLEGQEILQLVNQGVPVWDLLSKATGKSAAALQHLSETGQLGREVIQGLIDEMGKMNTGASANLMNTFSGAVSNAKDALQIFLDMVAKAGVLDFLTKEVQDLLAEFDRLKQSGELQTWAKRIGGDIVTVLQAIKLVSQGIVQFRTELGVLFALAAGNKLASLVGSLVTLAAGAKTAEVAVTSLGGRLAGIATRVNIVLALSVIGIDLYKQAAGLIDNLIEAKAKIDAASHVTDLVPQEEIDRLKKARDGLEETNALIKKVGNDTDTARAQTSKWISDFLELRNAGKTAGEALQEVIKKADFSSPEGVSKLIGQLNAVGAAGQASAEEVHDALSDALSKLSNTDFKAFVAIAQRAYDDMVSRAAEAAAKGQTLAEAAAEAAKAAADAEAQYLAKKSEDRTINEAMAIQKLKEEAQKAQAAAAISAQGMANAMESALGGAMKKMGLDLEQVRTKVSKAFRDMQDDFALVLKAPGSTQNDIGKSFEKLVDTAKSREEVKLLEDEFQRLKEGGVLTGKALEDAQAKLQDKLSETAGQVDGPLGDSFRRLGVRTAGAMSAAFQQMVVDFNRIKGSGVASAEGIAQAYLKIKSSVDQSISLLTLRTREALDAAKQHTAAVQADASAISAQGKALEASANAEHAMNEYAQAEAEAQKTGSEAARAKADALLLCAQAAQASADAAAADAKAQQDAAAAAQATEAAQKALLDAEHNPTAASKAAAAAAQDAANAAGQVAEESKQAAIGAKSMAEQLQSSANAAKTLAADVQDVNKTIDETHIVLDKTGKAVTGMVPNWESLIGVVNSAKSAAGQLADEATNAANGIYAAYQNAIVHDGRNMDWYSRAIEQAKLYGAQLGLIESQTKRNEEATKSWKDALDGIKSVNAGLQDEINRMMGRNDLVEQADYLRRKADMEKKLAESYNVDPITHAKTATDVTQETQDALANLDKLHALKMDQIRAEAAAKQASDAQSHDQALQNIASEKAAAAGKPTAAQVSADLLGSLTQPSAGNQAYAAALSASSAPASVVNNYTTTNNVNVDGKDLLSDDQIRRRILPALDGIGRRTR